MAVFKSPLFRKLFLISFVLIAAPLAVLDSFLTTYIADRETHNGEQRLGAEARILAGEVRDLPLAQAQEWASQAAARAHARVTVVDERGLLIADSERAADADSLSEISEIVQARAQGSGVSIRRSTVADRDFCFFAIAVSGKAPGLVLRLAVPLEERDAAVGAVRWLLLATSLAALALAMVIAYLFSRRFTGRIRDLQAFAERLVETRALRDLPPDADDELGALARSLNRMAAQLRDSLDRLSLESARREAILSSMVEGVLAVDQHMRITFCNDSFARVTGIPLPVPERAPLLEVVRDAGLLDMLSQVLASETPVKQRLLLPAANGHSFEVQAAPLSVSSRWGAIAVLHDITDLERLERVRKDFVANVSHELRTPLAAIRGYAETLLEGALEDPENNRNFVEIIKAQAARLNNIASDLLVLSELESGRAEPAEPEQFSVRSVLESALRTVESEARVRGIKLITDRVQDATVVGSRIRLEQALVNLIDNAIKFNRPAGEVRIAAESLPDCRLRITVADTGIGIPSEDLSRIFERFYRVDKARSRAVGGTGLGLSIVKHVLERMNGRITVESELGKGTRFSIILPSKSSI